MEGTTFTERLATLAGTEGSNGENARAVQKLIDGLPKKDRESITGAADIPRAISTIRERTKDELEALDGMPADGLELLEAYGKLPPKKRPSLNDWLKEKLSADDADKSKAERLLSFLNAFEPEDIRKEILSSGGVAKFKKAVEEKTEKLDAGLSSLDAVESALTQQAPPGPADAPLDHLEYLAEQEASGDVDAGTLRQILSQPAIQAQAVAGTAKLSEIMNAIDQDTTQTRSKQQRIQLKAAAKRLRDSYRTEISPASFRDRAGSVVRIISTPQNASILAIILVAAVVILYGLMRGGVLVQFADNSIARGFITLIFAVGTIAIFMTITAAIVFDLNSSSKDIYERAKTILSMLLGVFGTVLGFYFGLTEKGAVEELSVQQIEFVKADRGELNFTTSVTGGTAPYKFYIQVTDTANSVVPIGNLNSPLRSSDGALTFEEPLDVAVHAGKTVKILVVAEDSKARTALSTSIPVKIPAPR